MGIISAEPKREEATKRLQDVAQEDVFRLPNDP